MRVFVPTLFLDRMGQNFAGGWSCFPLIYWTICISATSWKFTARKFGVFYFGGFLHFSQFLVYLLEFEKREVSQFIILMLKVKYEDEKLTQKIISVVVLGIATAIAGIPLFDFLNRLEKLMYLGGLVFQIIRWISPKLPLWWKVVKNNFSIFPPHRMFAKNFRVINFKHFT